CQCRSPSQGAARQQLGGEGRVRGPPPGRVFIFTFRCSPIHNPLAKSFREAKHVPHHVSVAGEWRWLATLLARPMNGFDALPGVAATLVQLARPQPWATMCFPVGEIEGVPYPFVTIDV